MGDDSRKPQMYSLKNEWTWLWESIVGDSNESEDSFETGQLRVLSLDDVRRLTRELSHGRRKLNRRLEMLTKELELNTTKLESLRLVGAEEAPLLQRIHALHEQGQRITQDLADLDEKLRIAREREQDIRVELVPGA